MSHRIANKLHSSSSRAHSLALVLTVKWRFIQSLEFPALTHQLDTRAEYDYTESPRAFRSGANPRIKTRYNDKGEAISQTWRTLYTDLLLISIISGLKRKHSDQSDRWKSHVINTHSLISSLQVEYDVGWLVDWQLFDVLSTRKHTLSSSLFLDSHFHRVLCLNIETQEYNGVMWREVVVVGGTYQFYVTHSAMCSGVELRILSYNGQQISAFLIINCQWYYTLHKPPLFNSLISCN